MTYPYLFDIFVEIMEIPKRLCYAGCRFFLLYENWKPSNL